jgi:hypothetical protein
MSANARCHIAATLFRYCAMAYKQAAHSYPHSKLSQPYLACIKPPSANQQRFFNNVKTYSKELAINKPVSV